MDKLITLLNDEHISDIRIVSHDCIYVKRDGEKENISVLFDSKEEYLQFIRDVTKQNHVVVNESNIIRKLPFSVVDQMAGAATRAPERSPHGLHKI